MWRREAKRDEEKQNAKQDNGKQNAKRRPTKQNVTNWSWTYSETFGQGATRSRRQRMIPQCRWSQACQGLRMITAWHYCHQEHHHSEHHLARRIMVIWHHNEKIQQWHKLGILQWRIKRRLVAQDGELRNGKSSEVTANRMMANCTGWRIMQWQIEWSDSELHRMANRETANRVWQIEWQIAQDGELRKGKSSKVTATANHMMANCTGQQITRWQIKRIERWRKAMANRASANCTGGRWITRQQIERIERRRIAHWYDG
jgi:hypothetical protein